MLSGFSLNQDEKKSVAGDADILNHGPYGDGTYVGALYTAVLTPLKNVSKNVYVSHRTL